MSKLAFNVKVAYPWLARLRRLTGLNAIRFNLRRFNFASIADLADIR